MNELTTRSIGLAAALKLNGYEPATVERDETGRTVFHYPRTPAVTALADGFYAGTLLVVARDFNQAWYETRSRYIHQ
jgi:hypothetical protein